MRRVVWRARGWLAWRLAKPWMVACHDRAKPNVEANEHTTGSFWMGQFSAMNQMKQSMLNGHDPGEQDQ